MSGKLLVLAPPGDTGAVAVARQLTARVGPDHVLALTPADLVRARWSHRVTARGATSTRITLPTGTVLHDEDIGAVLNRLTQIPPAAGAPSAAVKDLVYARSERQALAASWLLSLAPRVAGLISAYGTVHGPVSPTTALIHAERCGLPVARRGGATRSGLIGRPAPGERHVPRLAWPGGRGSPVPVDVLPEQQTADCERLLRAGDHIIGGHTGYTAHCRRLAGELGTPLFELRLAPGPGGPVVTDVNLCPPLDDDRHVAATAALLVALAEQPTRRQA
ncbi:hypothetical protein ACH44C_00835 [Streptomyces purpureus]|uniref:hypothetical protein n=2 Tax=Streptomyces purpureus TaxID=1951 RepID=UPI000382B417|nr:hypothetical protein [Streptomyces purpureus]